MVLEEVLLLKGTKTVQNEKGLLDPQPMPSYGQEAAEEAIQLQTLFLCKRKNDLEVRTKSLAGRAKCNRESFTALGAGPGSNQGSGNICQGSLKNHYGPASVASMFTHFERIPVLNGNIYCGYPMPIPTLYIGLYG